MADTEQDVPQAVVVCPECGEFKHDGPCLTEPRVVEWSRFAWRTLRECVRLAFCSIAGPIRVLADRLALGWRAATRKDDLLELLWWLQEARTMYQEAAKLRTEGLPTAVALGEPPTTPEELEDDAWILLDATVRSYERFINYPHE